MDVHRYAWLVLLLAWPGPGAAQTSPALTAPAQSADGPAADGAQALVERALENELTAAGDTKHPMRYTLRKTSPRLSSTKMLIETKDGQVARLVAINNEPLSAEDEKKELNRLDGLLGDPGRQKHRKDSEDADAARAMKVLRALPKAFLYEAAGADAGAAAGMSPSGQAQLEKFNFKPNPAFHPPDLETEVLTAMDGAIWIDAATERVTRLEGRLEHDEDFGWGILGRLNKGGCITIEQADVGGGQWRIVRFEMQMTGRVLFKSKVFDTVEVERDFVPVELGLGYQRAIEMLREGAAGKRAAH